jgi:hypothetical protein
MSHCAKSAGARPVCRSFSCQLPPRNIAASPGKGGAGQLLVIVVPEHGPRRRAALDRVARKPRSGASRAGSAPSPNVGGRRGRPVRRPAPRTSPDDRRPSLPIGRRCKVAGDVLVARDAACRVEQLGPRARRQRHEVLAIEQHAAVCLVPQPENMAVGIDRVWMVNGRKSRRSSSGQRRRAAARDHSAAAAEAVDRWRRRAGGRAAAASCSWPCAVQRGHHRDAQLHAGCARASRRRPGECVRDRRRRQGASKSCCAQT